MLAPMTYTATDTLRLPGGPVSLADLDPGGTPGFDAGKKQGVQALADLGGELAEQRARLEEGEQESCAS